MHHSTITQATCPCCHDDYDMDEFDSEYDHAFVNKVNKQFGSPVCRYCLDEIGVCPQCSRMFNGKGEEAQKAQTDGEICCSQACADAFDKDADAWDAHYRSETHGWDQV